MPISSRIFLIACVILGLSANPLFAADEGKSEKPKKVSELLRQANAWVSQAQEAYVDGKGNEAIELYRKSLKEIERVIRENPDRAKESEFAPVRFRKSLCETEIDRIILEESQATARVLTVTDTAALSRKRLARRREAETNHVPEKAVALDVKRADGSTLSKKERAKIDKMAEREIAKSSGPEKKLDIKGELEFAKDMISVDRLKDARLSLLKILKADPEHREARYLMAVYQLQVGEGGDAQIILDDLLADDPKDEAALLLSAGASYVAGRYMDSMGFLDRALKANPRRPEGYYDMAWLLLEMNGKDLSQPEMYYRQAVKLGGPRDRDLERRLGIKQR